MKWRVRWPDPPAAGQRRHGAGCINGVHHLGIRTTNLERLLTFYRDVLGFEVAAVLGDRGGCEPDGTTREVVLSCGNLYMNLVEAGARGVDAATHDQPGKEIGFCLVCLDVADIEVTLATLEAAGLAVYQPPEHSRDGMRVLQARDPDGNVLQFQALSRPDHPLGLARLPLNAG